MQQTSPQAGDQVTKAVVPVAGLGTRFLPATKSVPKEMLPVVDRPAIHYVVEEAVTAGLADVLFINGRGKQALEDYFDHNTELEASLRAKGDEAKLRLVNEPTELAQIHSVRQGAPLGLGHAVLMAQQHVGQEPFAVLLGDDLIDAANPILERMLQVREQHGGSVLCLMEVPREDIALYGCAAVSATDEDDVLQVTGLVEKPPAEEAPSSYAIIGRYILDPKVFDVLERTEPGKGGEIQLTDALAALIDMPVEAGGGVHGVVFDGLRYDTGDRHSYLTTVIRLACERDDLGPRLREWLRGYVSSEMPSAD